MSKETLSKKDLINSIHEKHELPKTQVTAIVNDVFDTIIDAVAKGTKVQLTGFGNFEARERAERSGRNPQTGETITIASKKAPVFKAGKTFKGTVNK